MRFKNRFWTSPEAGAMRGAPRLFLATGIYLLVGLSGSMASAVDVTCGDVVPAGEIGDLVADADCTGASIFLDNGATLRLHGHTISGTDPNPEVCFPFLGTCSGVWCRGRRCRVEGPGTIQGFSSGIGGRGAIGGGLVKVVASNLTLQFNSGGISADRAVVTDVIASDNLSVGIAADRLRVRRVQANRNGRWGFSGTRVSGADVEANLNGDVAIFASAGVRAERMRLKRLTATGNIGQGVLGERVALRGSVVTGNTRPDISSLRRPRIRSTTCETSSDQVGGDWDICSLD